jgi:hypothetical protein
VRTDPNKIYPFFQQVHKSLGDVDIVFYEASKEISLSLKTL